jgi:hypothetical protein
MLHKILPRGRGTIVKHVGAVVPLLLVCLSSSSLAQQVTGRVWVAETGQAAAGATVTITCSGRSQPARADRNGVYRMSAPGSGECTAEVSFGGKGSSRVPFHMEGGRTTVNLELSGAGDRWSLRRR